MAEGNRRIRNREVGQRALCLEILPRRGGYGLIYQSGRNPLVLLIPKSPFLPTCSSSSMLLYCSAETCIVYEGSSGTITKSGDSNSLGDILLEEYLSAQQVRLP